ncbi:MAG: hypothetical protein Kow0090_04620 [Myxococcota bacterium]
MVKGMCKDCVFSEDLSEGMPEGESLWICWAKRKEYHEPPQVCAQFQPKEEGASAAEEIASIADSALGMTPADHIADMKSDKSPDIEAPEFYEKAKEPQPPEAEEIKLKEEGGEEEKELTPSEESLFGDRPPIAKEEVSADGLTLGAPSKSFSERKTDPKAGNIISAADTPKPRKSNIRVLLLLLLLVLIAGGVSYILLTPEGEKYDYLNLRSLVDVDAILGKVGKSPTPTPTPTPVVKTPRPVEKKPVEDKPATPQEVAREESGGAAKDEAVKTTGTVAAPSEKEAARTGEEEAKEEPKEAKLGVKEKGEEKALGKPTFVGPEHKTPTYILVDTISGKKETALKRYESLKKRGFLCGYLWIPDYPSLSGQDRWMVFVGPFDTLEEAKWRLDIYKKRVRATAFGARLDMKPIKEQF